MGIAVVLIALALRSTRRPRALLQDRGPRACPDPAVDVPAIVREVLQGYGVIATGQFPPRLSFSLRHDQADQNVKDTAIIVQEFLKKVGVEARIEPLDWPTFDTKLFASEFEGIVVGWTNFHDPDPFAYTIWHSSQWKGRNFAHYKNSRADASIEAARRTADQGERKKHYAEFSKIMMEDAPYVFLCYAQQVYVTRQAYEGFVPIAAFGGIYQSMKAVRWTGR